MKITNYVDGKMDVHLTLSKGAIHRILEGDEQIAKEIVDSLIHYIKSVRGESPNSEGE